MQRFSINNISSDYVYGFDLDGTLYDEYEFISQVYVGIAKYISQIAQVESDLVYRKICALWLLYGSSKRDLFQKFFLEFGITPNSDQIKYCLQIYRTADFKLILPNRSRLILNLIQETGASIFIVTDGNSDLQRRKIASLGLSKWFDESKIFISGDYGTEYQKPNIIIRPIIEKEIRDFSKVIYFGDRDIDRLFAEEMKFGFCRMISMHSLG